MLKVTVAIITYERPLLLKKSIQSVINQTYSNLEILIVDNGSSSETALIIDSFKDDRIVKVKSIKNYREFYNYPFFIAKGNYLIITHDDDCMHSTLVEQEVLAMQSNPNAVAVSCNMRAVDLNHNVVNERINPGVELLVLRKGDFFKLYESDNYIFTPTVMFDLDYMRRRSLLFESRLGPAADQYLWYQILKHDAEIIVLPNVLYDYTVHNQQDSVINGVMMNLRLNYILGDENLSNIDSQIVILKKIILLKLNYPNYFSEIEKANFNKILFFSKLNLFVKVFYFTRFHFSSMINLLKKVVMKIKQIR